MTINFNDNFGPPPKLLDPKHQKGTLKNGSEPSILCQKSKVLDDTPCKTKQSQLWEDVNHDRQIRKLWEDNPSSQTTPMRATLEITRKIF